MSVRTLGMAPSGGAQIATGTYTGDGAATQAIVGVGFQPKYTQIWKDAVQSSGGSNIQGWKITQDGVFAGLWVCGTTAASRYLADHIISLDADGFTVGDGTGPWLGFAMPFNVLGVTYHYLCFG